jgi:hypothetical protein
MRIPASLGEAFAKFAGDAELTATAFGFCEGSVMRRLDPHHCRIDGNNLAGEWG